MLTLIFGRAGTGKTAYVMSNLHKRMLRGETGLYLLVPEQYSHDAERQLCAICGDALSLHGEALSFSRLATRIFTETGGLSDKTLDAGALMLVMCRALESVSPELRAYRGRGMRIDFIERLLETAREMKNLGIRPETLSDFAALTAGAFSDKLRDLSLILAAYDSFFGGGTLDPSDRLTLAARRLAESGIGDSGCVCFDGFNDFTAQEMAVITGLFKKNADMTFCLTCGGLDGGEDVFELPRMTARQLTRLASEYGHELRTEYMSGTDGRRVTALRELELRLFSRDTTRYDKKTDAIEVYRARDAIQECEIAAAMALKLVQNGYRWRDIAVVTPDWAGYGELCGGVLEKFGVPYFSGGREDFLQKPPIALIDAALETIITGWDYAAVFRYLKTGLAGLSALECAELENYVYKWNIRGSMWTREQDWSLPAGGYGSARDDAALERINSLRRRAAAPLAALERSLRAPNTADKLTALYRFLEEIELPRRLAEKSELMLRAGRERLAGEYSQLWDICVNALEQFYDIAGGTALDTPELRRLLGLLFSRYDVGVIPVSLDRVSLGEMTMSRRRDIRCLIVLGATDTAMPKARTGGVFSDYERGELIRLGAAEAAGSDFGLYRELNMIYSSLTLPGDKLVVTYPAGARASTVVRRIRAIFGLEELSPDERAISSLAPEPCFELLSSTGGLRAFDGLPEFERRVSAARRAGNRTRTRLSPDAARLLYGDTPRLSASSAERYGLCKYSFFLQNGLRAARRDPAAFDARGAGTFTHYILERVTRDLLSAGIAVEERAARELIKRYAAEYRENVLGGETAGGRLEYLLNRLEQDAAAIVLDTARDLQGTGFMPLGFESEFLDISPEGHVIRGLVDRIDGLERDGTLYLRVVDYKTGRKAFSLSDVLHGVNMQMLIYLFSLCRTGPSRFGRETAPAGVLYSPARGVIIKAPRNTPESEIAKLRERELRRTGIILAGTDEPGGAFEAGAEQMTLLERHVGRTLRGIASGIRSGEIDRSPLYKSPSDNACLYCEYAGACQFSEDAGDRRRYVKTQSPAEFWDALKESDGK